MKEIVITNKSGITLPTKKTLVDDDIKIKIDKSLVGIDGVSVERGLYGAKDLFINGNELPSDTTGLMIDSYAGNINIYNSTEKNDEKINLQLSGYIDVSLNDSHPENIITSENLTPENIVKDVNILGVTGTYEGSGNTLKNLLDATKSANYLFFGYYGNANALMQYNDTVNVTNFKYMFSQYQGGDLSPINTSNGVYFNYMFESSRLNKIDISKFTSTSTSNSSGMCNSCRSLKALIIRSFGDNYVLNSNAFTNDYFMLGTQNAVYNPNGEQGYVYVPRNMIATLQSATNWSTLQFRALEDYTKDGTTTGEFDDEKAGL